ncbi:MAG: acyltransferase, partial [[Bacteroides] pectinophilus]|nr:acyltransferase [[Bacteroides] pectinophilus]
IVSCKSKYHNDNVKRIVGISLFSFNCDCLFKDNERWSIKEKISYRKDIFIMDLNKSVIKSLTKINYDKLFIDFIDSTQDIWQCILEDGRVFRCTYNDIFKDNINYIKENIISKAKCAIRCEEILNPINWNDVELNKEILKLSKRLLALDMSKTTIFNSYIPFRYKINGTIYNCQSPQKIADTNTFSEKCAKKLCDIIKCSMLNRTEFVLGGDKYIDTFGLSYTPEYYHYINKCILYGQTNELLKDYIETLQTNVDICTLNFNVGNIKNLLNCRKLILICQSEDVFRCFTDTSGIACNSYIRYSDVITPQGQLCPELLKLRGKSKEYLIVISHLKRNDNLLKLLWEIGFCQNIGCYVPQIAEFCLNNFKGYFSDIYHNRVLIQSDYVNARLFSHASDITISEGCSFYKRFLVFVYGQSKVFVAKNVRADQMDSSCFDGATISIGECSSFADHCVIATSAPFMNINIEKDCMFSSKIVCFGGDGHAIFDINTMSRSNLNPSALSDDKMRINVHEHVWVGYQAFIMAGSDIGSGTIIGARSLVNKHIPNNVIAAGKPASVIKKDITWSRDPFCHNIYENPDLLSAEYIKRTGE